VPASQAVLTGQSIVHRNVITLDEALQYVLGVILNHGDVDIRGSTGIAGGVGSRVLFLMDATPCSPRTVRRWTSRVCRCWMWIGWKWSRVPTPRSMAAAH